MKQDDKDFEAVRQEVDGLHDEEEAREKALLPYSDNLPYDRNRVIEEAKFLIKHEIVAKYEIGKRLILLREQESVHTYGQILKEHFPGMSRSCAYNYMLFARKVSQLPKLKGFAESGGNWYKCLALLEACDEDELAALEAGEPVAGVDLDEVDKMTVRELKKALRKEKDKTNPLQEQIAGLDAEKRGLQDEIDLLKSGKPSCEYYINQVKKLELAVTEVVKIYKGIPRAAIKEHFELGNYIAGALSLLERQVENLSLDFNAANKREEDSD